MNSSPSLQVWFVVLGAVLALATSVVVEIVRWRLSEARGRRLLKALLRGEIGLIVGTCEQISEETERQGFLGLLRMANLEGARQGFDRNRDWAILFKEEAFQRDLFNFYLELNSLVREAQGAEAMASAEHFRVGDGLQWMREQRSRIARRFGDMVHKGRDLLNRLERQ